MRILPDIFTRRHTRLQHKAWLTKQFKQYAEGDLVEAHQRSAEARAEHRHLVAWWPIDETRQSSAQELALNGMLTSLTHSRPDNYMAACASSTKTDVTYALLIERLGKASCSCTDFLKNGRACKHLRALQLLLDALVIAGHERPFLFPATRLEALQIEQGIDLDSTAGNPYLDLPALQAIGADNTVLGDGLGDGVSGFNSDGTLEEVEGDEEDNGSKEDYTGQDSGLVTAAAIVHTPQVNQQAAIEQQMHSKLYMELCPLLPRLQGIDNLLSDVTSLPSDPTQLNEFYDIAQSITQHISAI
ncbi:hypothetical protein F5878DRAFT_666769 [Lentinula raphanica]|uniref:SWIM-type domain-containing protein n=1 Tax=Lentinula raphanica TaxID=153919 RepID=A0AA38NX26_9AGAR|nr:hypothetical protein F5878DRAFT_666769 [Lentinula raphanica]